MCRIISAGHSRRSAEFAEILSLCSLIAAMIGAAFIKLGRAPTTVRTFILRAWDRRMPRPARSFPSRDISHPETRSLRRRVHRSGDYGSGLHSQGDGGSPPDPAPVDRVEV